MFFALLYQSSPIEEIHNQHNPTELQLYSFFTVSLPFITSSQCSPFLFISTSLGQTFSIKLPNEQSLGSIMNFKVKVVITWLLNHASLLNVYTTRVSWLLAATAWKIVPLGRTRTCLNKCSVNLNVWKHYSCCYYLSQKQYSERCGIKLQAASCCPAIWTSCSFEKYVFETSDQKPDVQTEQDSNSKYPEIVFCIWSNIMKVWRPVNQVASKDTW